MRTPLDPHALESALREIGAKRYHDNHPFHQLLHGGKLNRRQVQAWALNRYYYQRQIPIKDAGLIARLEAPICGAHGARRLVDHDGEQAASRAASSVG